MSTRTQTASNDVVALLLRQHEEIQRLFAEVERSTGKERAAAFDRLRRLLAVHETAEELIVHPDARRVGSDRVVDARLTEERNAKERLEELEQKGPDAPDFLARLRELKKAVMDHARHEEREEFPKIEAAHGTARLQAMGIAVRAAEAMAPTHPHAGVESVKANLLVGPYAAMRDRARDIIRKAMPSSSDDGPTKVQLYREATKRGVKGRVKEAAGAVTGQDSTQREEQTS
jgi:hemerythrin superfamily protein